MMRWAGNLVWQNPISNQNAKEVKVLGLVSESPQERVRIQKAEEGGTLVGEGHLLGEVKLMRLRTQVRSTQ